MSFLTGAIRTAAAGTSARAAMLGHCSTPIAIRQVRAYAAHQKEESFEAFTARYVSFFENAEDLFEVQRGLNNCFAYDLVPAPEVIEAALRASRRIDSFAMTVRVFEGIKAKVENKGQYEKYLEALKPLREELGITLKEELYPSSS